MEIIFGIQDAKHPSLPLSAQEMVNCYTEQPIQNSRATAPVISCYGITTHSDLAGIISTKVINDVFYVLTSEGLYTVRQLSAHKKHHLSPLC